MRDLQTGFEIVDLPQGEKITKNGFYRLSLDRHHNQPCDGVSVTSGTLRKMELETPADVWAFHKLNPDRWPDKDSDALRMGRAIACFIEGGPELLEEEFRVLPKDKPNKPTAVQLRNYADGRASDAALRSIEFWDAVDKDGRDIISEDEWDRICTMGKVLAADPAAAAALGGIPEITMAWKDEVNDLWCLSRPDQISFDGMLSDYKKAAPRSGAFNARFVDRRITEYAYDMQMGFAEESFEVLTGNKPSAVGLVFQLDKPPHHVILREIDAEDLSIATFLNRRARRRFRECLDSGHWYGPNELIGSYHRPDWQRETLIEEMNTENQAP